MFLLEDHEEVPVAVVDDYEEVPAGFLYEYEEVPATTVIGHNEVTSTSELNLSSQVPASTEDEELGPFASVLKQFEESKKAARQADCKSNEQKTATQKACETPCPMIFAGAGNQEVESEDVGMSSHEFQAMSDCQINEQVQAADYQEGGQQLPKTVLQQAPPQSAGSVTDESRPQERRPCQSEAVTENPWNCNKRFLRKRQRGLEESFPKEIATSPPSQMVKEVQAFPSQEEMEPLAVALEVEALPVTQDKSVEPQQVLDEDLETPIVEPRAKHAKTTDDQQCQELASNSPLQADALEPEESHQPAEQSQLPEEQQEHQPQQNDAEEHPKEGQTHYEVLKVPTDAKFGDIKESWRLKIIKYHPDRNNGDVIAKTRFQLVQAAWEALKDHGKRSAYDRELVLTAQQHIMEETIRKAFETSSIPFDPRPVENFKQCIGALGNEVQVMMLERRLIDVFVSMLCGELKQHFQIATYCGRSQNQSNGFVLLGGNPQVVHQAKAYTMQRFKDLQDLGLVAPVDGVVVIVPQECTPWILGKCRWFLPQHSIWLAGHNRFVVQNCPHVAPVISHFQSWTTCRAQVLFPDGTMLEPWQCAQFWQR